MNLIVRKKSDPYCRRLSGERSWDGRTAFGRHLSRYVGYFDIPGILLTRRTLILVPEHLTLFNAP